MIPAECAASVAQTPLPGLRLYLPVANQGPRAAPQGLRLLCCHHSSIRFRLRWLISYPFPLHLGVTDDRWRCTPADPPFSADGWEVVQQSGAPNVKLFVSVKGMIRLKIIACRPN